MKSLYPPLRLQANVFPGGLLQGLWQCRGGLVVGLGGGRVLTGQHHDGG